MVLIRASGTSFYTVKAIGLSLYGNKPRYCLGAVENAKMAPEFYPGWEVHLWYGNDVPGQIIEMLRNCGAVVHSAPGNIGNGMLWRHLAHDLKSVDRYVIRDVDSRFSKRETDAVNQWIESGKTIHVMRDHPYHLQTMMGGMWGLKRSECDFSMSEMIRLWPDLACYGSDQRFVSAAIWERTYSRLIHDSCGTFDGTVNWPSSGPQFVGEYISENGEFNSEHRKLRLDHLSKLKQ